MNAYIVHMDRYWAPQHVADDPLSSLFPLWADLPMRESDEAMLKCQPIVKC